MSAKSMLQTKKNILPAITPASDAASHQKSLVSQPPLLQPKLTIGQPNDPYEQEADRVADMVMRMPEPKVQRQPGKEESEENRLTNRAPDGNSSAGISVSQVDSPMIHRREFPNETNPSELGPGDWLVNDRVYASPRWQTANLYNLKNQRPHEYTQPHERKDFYLWVYNHTSELGSKTRWPLAAYIVAGGAARLSYGKPFENGVQIMARRGNQIIFDDSFPKLRGLVDNPIKDEKTAFAWDAQMLSEEQTLIQAMYETTRPETVDQFSRYAHQEGVLATSGAALGFTRPHRPGSFHRVQDTPAFSGDIRNIDDRFAYGMDLANLFSTHPKPEGQIVRPRVGTEYTSGARFRQLDSRVSLHELDAELDDQNVDEDKVIKIMQGLGPNEQRELGYNMQRLEFMRNALNRGELERALNGLVHVSEKVRRILLP